jgi:hypothetical protein
MPARIIARTALSFPGGGGGGLVVCEGSIHGFGHSTVGCRGSGSRVSGGGIGLAEPIEPSEKYTPHLALGAAEAACTAAAEPRGILFRLGGSGAWDLGCKGSAALPRLCGSGTSDELPVTLDVLSLKSPNGQG